MKKTPRVSLRPESGIYFYVRRVPKRIAHLDARGVIRQSLKTTSFNEAAVMAEEIDRHVEAFWASLILGANPSDSLKRYEAAMSVVRNLGFVYRSAAEIMKLGLSEAVPRMMEAERHLENPVAVEALLGKVPEVDVTLGKLVETYLEKNKVALGWKSEAQLKKHTSQRNGAVAVALQIIGDKPLGDITKSDTLLYRQHWVDRVAAGEVTKEGANRSMSDIKGMISVLDDIYHEGWGDAWSDIRIKGKKQTKEKRKRPPYSNEFVQKQLLAPGALDGMNEDARFVFYTMIETGMGISEACNLRPEDIALEHPTPHVKVSERDDREQKTVYRIREIPLVGVSLWAMKQRPNGFPAYADRQATLSNTINKFLRENGLQPTAKHSAYSLRHTFQDRLTAAGANDRLQVDLMGHDLGRPDYGQGAPLEQKLEMLNRIKFTWHLDTGHQPTVDTQPGA
jgi:integrase